jgi:Polyketide cyclase / dehydrase and lipid transport
MILTILIALVLFAVVFVIIVALRPGEFRVTRTINISASPTALFAQVNDLQKWQAWSPYARLDPDAKNIFEGPLAGKDASMSWIGNKKVGEGRMTIMESHPDDLVRFRLDFKKPFAATHVAEFTFKPAGNQTAITWSLTGKFNFMVKAIGMFMDCDKMIGSEFEKGLANLKTIAEAANKKQHE